MNQGASFGKFVKEQRLIFGLTQAELARRVGCATITVRKIEGDTLRPSVQIAERLAMALDIALDERAEFVRWARRALQDTPEPPPTPTPPPSAKEIGQEDLTGRAVRGYKLAELIGAGGFGAIYRATQPSVEREVAVKIILPRFANDPDFIRRFEAEAQLVARLEHPFIVPLYDYWREPNAAYLVMRLMRGGSLNDLLQDGALPLERTLPILDQVSQALHAAHRFGVVHRDLKPANILLDEDGNAYLADFGIAKNLGDPEMAYHTKIGDLIGSYAYLSPEQIRSETVRPQADIYALGVLLFQLLVGELPFEGPTPVDYFQQHLTLPIPSLLDRNPGLPEAMEDVIRRATAKQVSERYVDVMVMLTEIREAVKAPGFAVEWAAHDVTLVDPDDIENPFKGLRPFREADAEDFFGRETLVQDLMGALGTDADLSRFLAVVGPSGSGKSSVVKAGLVPALRRGGLPGSQNWFIADFLPGSHPFEELEAALLRVAVNPPGSLLEQLQSGERGLSRAVRRVLPQDDSVELVLVIDQFEELFTLVSDREIRDLFIDSLVTAVMDPSSRMHVIITLRADFIDRPLEYVDLGELLRERSAFVLPLTPDELEEAVNGPTRRVGLIPETGLTARIVRELGDQPGMLPLLQHALSELYERRDGRRLTLKAYKQIGGVLGSLGGSAEDLFQALSEPHRVIARQLFLRLMTLGEGVEDTRRRVLRSEVEALGVGVDTVIDAFGHARLLTFDRDPLTRSATVEVAHEALLREWSRLRAWIDESRADVRMQRVLAQAALDWQTHGQDESFLLRGARLDQFAGWNENRTVALTGEELVYLEASLAAREARAAAEAARQERETALEQRSKRFLRGLVIVLSVAAVIAGSLSIFAFSQQRLAEDSAEAALAEANGRATQQVIAESEALARATQQAVAEAEAAARAVAEQQAVDEQERAVKAEQEALRQASIGLAALAEKEIGGVDRELSILLALEAVENYPYTPQAAAALSQTVEEFRSVRVLETSQAVFNIKNVAAWSPDGTRIAAASSPSPDAVFIWDSESDRELIAINPFQEGCAELELLVFDIAWSPDSKQLAVIGQDLNSGTSCGIYVLDATNGITLLHIDGYESAARSLDWSPDGAVILSAHEDGVLRLWNITDGSEVMRLEGHTGVARDAVYSPDGRLIASASEDATVRIWDPGTGLEQRVLSGHSGFVRSIEWSPDGKRLISGGDDALPRVWDATSGETLFVLPGHTEGVVIVTWSADGLRLASQGFDAKVKVWDAATGGFLYQISNAAPDTNTKRGFVDFSPDGNWILTAGSRVLGVHAWDASVSTPILFGHTFGQEWGSWSPDGSLIATSGTDGSARLWDAQTAQQIGEFDQGSFWSAWAPDGSRLVFAEGIFANALNIWDVATGNLLSRLYVEDDEFGPHSFLASAWSPDGTQIAGGDFRPGRPGGIYIWDVNSSLLESTILTDDLCQLGWPVFSPDSSQIAGGCIFVESGINTPARIWDVATGEVLMTLESEYGWTYRSVWSPDGTRILTTHENGAAIIWNIKTGLPERTFTEHRGVVDAQWSPDGALIASTDFETQQVKIWDAETGRVLMDFSVPGAPLTIKWHPDGTHVIVTGDGFNEPIIKRIWESTDELVAHAYDCCVTRQLTPEERAQFGLPQAED
jgi:WD40 repeat protein/serine/threonine protein kinase/DNA-binding XRE family transcriptional regulator